MPTVAFFPSLNDLAGNPYWRLLAEALEAKGVHVLPDNPRYLALRWLWAQRNRMQVLHIHYFQDNYAFEGTQARLRWVLRFARNLVAARLMGYHVVWTVHNEIPSFPLQPKWVEDLAHLALARLAHAVIVHCEYARELVARRYGRRRGVFVVPHPNFIEVYPGQVTRGEARTWLGLPDDAVVFLYFGQMRPNKGIEALLVTFADLPGDHLRLVIAGAPGPEPGYVVRLANLAAQDSRVLFRAEHVPDDRVRWYYAAADVAIAPFARVLTSSSVLLALSLGLPVIAPASGCLPETIRAGAGWLYNSDDPTGLETALRAASTADHLKAGRTALRSVETLTWAAMTSSTLQAYAAAA
jgi:glycosyltransferase involved in cell wall biosynthesis